jgi:hypothetical protein
MIAAERVNLSIEVDAHAVASPAKKNPPVEAIIGMVVRCPINAFRTTATNDAACPQCLVPSMAEIAEACGRTMQLARDVSCPHWPRPLGLVVHKVSLPAMSKPLWRDRYLACCAQISSLPAMSRALVGQDRWGLLCIRLARSQCRSPCGATAIRLAVQRIVAHPWSRAFWP